MTLDEAKEILSERKVAYSSIYTFERDDHAGSHYSFNQGDKRVALAWKDGTPLFSPTGANSEMHIYREPITDNTELKRRTYLEGTHGAALRIVIDAEEDEPAPIHWDFKAAVRVWDPRQLYAAACAMAIRECGAEDKPDLHAAATKLLGTADAPDIGACLVMMLDQSMPGATIEESAVESVYVQ